MRSFPFASMIASRWPIHNAPAEGLDVPFPERVQVAIVATPFGDVEVLNVHAPAATSSGVAVKVATFEGIARYLARPSAMPRIMVGDFNTPRAEAGRRTSYWGSAHQQGAERAVIEGHAKTGLRDAFRHVHGARADAVSWRASNKTPRRYDHVFASQGLVAVEATYGDLEQVKLDNMSDHAPLRVVFGTSLQGSKNWQRTAAAEPAADAEGVQLPPTPLEVQATPPEVTEMPTTSDTDLQAFLAKLTFRVDVRKPPDNRRRGQFRSGWNTATAGKEMTKQKLDADLSWNNLGYRAGKAFGQASDEEVYAMFYRFGAIYDRQNVTAD